MLYNSTNTLGIDECQIDFSAVSAKAHENLFFAGFVFRAMQETPRPQLSDVFRQYCTLTGKQYCQDEYTRLYHNFHYYANLLNLPEHENSGN